MALPLDTEDLLADGCVQEELDSLRSVLENFMLSGVSEETFDGLINNMTLSDFDIYIREVIQKGQAIEGSQLRLTKFQVVDPNLMFNTFDFSSIQKTEVSFENVVLYFLENKDFAILVFPYQLKEKLLNVQIKPLEDCKEEVKDAWYKALKVLKHQVSSLSEIPGVMVGISGIRPKVDKRRNKR